MEPSPLPRAFAELFEGHALFSLFGERALRTLVHDLELKSIGIGETIMEMGEPADSAYLVFSGRVRVFKPGPDGRPVTLATLTRGELLGEHAMLTDEARTASARAAEDTVLLRISRDNFSGLLREHPQVRPYLERLLENRALARFLQSTALLGSLPARQVAVLLDQFEDCRFASGACIIREGEIGDRMFIIKSGEAQVIKSQNGQEMVVAYLAPGDFFGERALLMDEPRRASVIALADTELVALSRAGFSRLMVAAPDMRDQLTQKLQHYLAVEELAAKFGVQPVRTRQPAQEIAWKKLDDKPQGRSRLRLHGPRTWLGLRKYPFVPQEDESDCGAASLAMIARYHNVPLSVERLRHLAHVGAEGASMLSLTAAAEAIGYECRAVTTDYDHLADMDLPAIAHWQDCHYLVVYGARNGRVLLGDPALGLRHLSRAEFEQHWKGRLVLLAPTKRLESNPPLRSPWRHLAAFLPTQARRLLLFGFSLDPAGRHPRRGACALAAPHVPVADTGDHATSSRRWMGGPRGGLAGPATLLCQRRGL